VKVLLDENFPLPLLGALRQAGIDTDHIISLGLRGVADQRIREMLRAEPIVFLTQDAEFLEAASPSMAPVVISRVRQSARLKHLYASRPRRSCSS
jgi:predicted nuclease of predicted toxin-antitoxin system